MRLKPFLLASAFLSIGNALGAQSYDPRTGSPFSLLRMPPDGVAHYEASLEARRLAEGGQDSAAVPLLERLTGEYPRNGEHWLLLARSLARLGRSADAAAAYQEAGRWRGERAVGGWTPVNGAINHLRAGNREAALAMLRQYIFEERGAYRMELWDLEALASLRGDPEFRRIAGRPDTTGWGRTEGRKRDIDYLVAEVRRVNPDPTLPPEFLARADSMRARVHEFTDEEFVVELNRMLAALRRGHTELFSGSFGGSVKLLPAQLYAFPEGIFIIDAVPEYRALVGARVDSIDGTSAEEALRLVNLMQSVDGEMQFLWNGMLLLRSAHYLRGSGIISSVDTIALTIRTPRGTQKRVRLATGAREGWHQLGAPPGTTRPLFLRHLDENHWDTSLVRHEAHYVQVNQMRNDSGETLAAFGRRLWTTLNSTTPRALIVDVRHNFGGSTALYTELLRTIVAFMREPERRLYVLIGRTTNSAAGNFVTDLERLAEPIFVGEPTSECCNLYGDPARVRLPYTQRLGVISAVRWNLSRDVFDGRREMSPHIPVALTAADYFVGRDPVMEAALRHMLERSPER